MTIFVFGFVNEGFLQFQGGISIIMFGFVKDKSCGFRAAAFRSRAWACSFVHIRHLGFDRLWHCCHGRLFAAWANNFASMRPMQGRYL